MRFLLLLMFALPVCAQEQEIQRALIQRDQQSAEFAARVRQSQDAIQLSPGDNRHLNEKQDLENLSETQLQSIQKDTPQELRPYERQKADQERILALPAPVARAKPTEVLRDHPSRMPSIVDVVPPKRSPHRQE